MGYQGMIAGVRQGADGQLKSICLSEPEVFVEELGRPAPTSGLKVLKAQGDGRIRRYESRWRGGVLALDAAFIRNIVVHHVPHYMLGELGDLGKAAGPGAAL